MINIECLSLCGTCSSVAPFCRLWRLIKSTNEVCWLPTLNLQLRTLNSSPMNRTMNGLILHLSFTERPMKNKIIFATMMLRRTIAGIKQILIKQFPRFTVFLPLQPVPSAFSHSSSTFPFFRYTVPYTIFSNVFLIE